MQDSLASVRLECTAGQGAEDTSIDGPGRTSIILGSGDIGLSETLRNEPRGASEVLGVCGLHARTAMDCLVT